MPNTPGIYGSFMRASLFGVMFLVVFTVLNIIVDGDPVAKAFVESLAATGTFAIGAFTADYMKGDY